MFSLSLKQNFFLFCTEIFCSCFKFANEQKMTFFLPIRNYCHKTEAFWVRLGTILTIQLKYYEFAEIRKLSSPYSWSILSLLKLGTIFTIHLKHFEFAKSLPAPAALLRITKKNWFKWSWFVDMIHRPDLFYIQRVGTSNFLRNESESGHLASNHCAIASRDYKKSDNHEAVFLGGQGKMFC